MLQLSREIRAKRPARWRCLACPCHSRQYRKALIDKVAQPMRIVVEQLGTSVWWRLRASDGLLCTVSDGPRWALVSPLVYATVLQHVGYEDYKQGGLPTPQGAESLLTTNVMVWETELEFSDGLCSLGTLLPRVRALFRYLSGQVQVPTGMLNAQMFSVDGLGKPSTEVRTLKQGIVIPNAGIETAVQWSHVEEARSLGVEWEMPAHADVFLDAVEGYLSGDFRKCILYCAVAAEAGARAVLFNAHHRAINSKDSHSEFRITEFSTKSGSIRKDPLFDVLVPSSRPAFRRLLHEASLYFLGKSLLVDDKVLYDDALKLYELRNSIVHSGRSPGLAVLTFAQALRCLRTTRKLLSWFGAKPDYAIPDASLIIDTAGNVIRHEHPRR